MRILLSGSSGFVGSEVFSYFRAQGHSVVCLKRGDPGRSGEKTIFWEPDLGRFVKEPFEGFDAVVHLAGEPIFGRWTRSKKQRILFSRTVGTWLLSHILAQTLQPPSVFLSASAVGYYGDRGEMPLRESSSAGCGFLPAVCCEWEKAARAIGERGARVVNARFGAVIGPGGGILQKMRFLYRWGLGGKLGSGNQWLSWVALPDLVRAIDFCLRTESIEGPVNVVSPHCVRQKQFADVLAKSLHRPAVLHVPAWVLHLVLGEMADEMILASQHVFPEKLQSAGFSFQTPTLKDCLRGVSTK